MKIVDLDTVILSRDAVVAWHAMVPQIGTIFIALGMKSGKDIPIEQGRVEEDGTLSIFVPLPNGKGEISMRVPPDQWARKQ